MRNILIISVFLVLSSCIQEKDKRIHITGELPVIQDSYAKMFIEQDGKRVLFRTAVKEGKFNLYFDSLEKGAYTFIFEWSRPFEKRYMTYRDKGGKVVRRYLPQVIRYIVLSKNFYINPEQSLSYFI
ncbi:MAG TPA: hypothetical protein VKZ95_04050, partial [Sphingobacteriaceae bacterium]|nr:hypothetical protein [Sphingobacteriaceae bacterium]